MAVNCRVPTVGRVMFWLLFGVCSCAVCSQKKVKWLALCCQGWRPQPCITPPLLLGSSLLRLGERVTQIPHSNWTQKGGGGGGGRTFGFDAIRLTYSILLLS